MQGDAGGEVAKWADYARQKIRRAVKLVAHPNSIEGVRRAYEESAVAHVKPKNDKYITIIYDCKLSGSASARSHIRIVPFRENHCKVSIK